MYKCNNKNRQVKHVFRLCKDKQVNTVLHSQNIIPPGLQLYSFNIFWRSREKYMIAFHYIRIMFIFAYGIPR